MQSMVHIVIPLRAEMLNPALGSRKAAGLVSIIFQHQMNFSILDTAPHGVANLINDVRNIIVKYCVDRIETQSVQMELFEPIERVVDKEIAHYTASRPSKIKGGAPRRMVPLGKEIWRNRRQIIPLRAKMIVDDIEQDRETAGVTSLDERLQILRPPVTRRRGVRKDPVIAPVATAGKLGDRHQLDRGDPEPAKVIEMPCSSGEIAGFGKCAEVQLVKNNLFPSPATPAEIIPIISPRIDHLARTMHSLRLIARSGIGNAFSVDEIAIPRAGTGKRGRQREPAFALSIHRRRALARSFELQRHGFGAGRP